MITVGGETCTEILSFEPRAETNRTQGLWEESRFSVNSAEPGISVGRVLDATAHTCRRLTFGPRVRGGQLGIPPRWSWSLYERVYVLDKAGRLRGKVRDFEVGDKADGTPYRGKEVTRGILPSY